MKKTTKDTQKSISIFSTQIESLYKEESIEHNSEILSIFQTWKNFVLKKKVAWEILYPEFRKLMKTNKKTLEFCFRLREKHLKFKCFYGIKKNSRQKINFKPVFIRKFLLKWKKYLKFVKQTYAGTYTIQEKQCTRIERCMLGMWRKRYLRVKKIKAFLNARNTKILKKNYEVLKNLAKSRGIYKKYLKFFIKTQEKSLKNQGFNIWYRLIQRKKSFIQQKQVKEANESCILYEEKVKNLEKQLLILSQDLAAERALGLSRDSELKYLLKLHADELYKSLCEN